MAENQENIAEERVRRWLEDLYKQLQLVHAGIVVASSSLRHQDAEQDVEVASVLDHFVGARVDYQIQRTEQLLRWLNSRCDPQEQVNDGGLLEHATLPTGSPGNCGISWRRFEAAYRIVRRGG